MDYQTKFLLQQIADAINHSNDAMVTLTIVNVFLSIVLVTATILLGRQQNQVQKNNIKSQLFDRRYKVYEAIVDAKAFLNRDDHFINGFYIENYFNNLGQMFLDKIERLNDAQLSAEALFGHGIHEKAENITALFAKARMKFFELNLVGYNYKGQLTPDQLMRIKQIVLDNAFDFTTMKCEIEKIIPGLFEKIPEWQDAVKNFNDYIRNSGIMTDFDDYLKISDIDK